jgi:hypothetical protein
MIQQSTVVLRGFRLSLVGIGELRSEMIRVNSFHAGGTFGWNGVFDRKV